MHTLFAKRRASLLSFTLTALAAAGTGSSAWAATTTVAGTWTGVPLGNVAEVTMTVDLDPEVFDFDLGPAGTFDHSWWYGPSNFSNMTVVVTGSTTPQYNGTFFTNSMNWVRIYSDLPTPTAALSTPGGAYADLGANYSVDYTPSDSGIGQLQVGVVNSTGGEKVTSAAIAAIPEPASLGLLALTVGAAALRRRWAS